MIYDENNNANVYSGCQQNIPVQNMQDHNPETLRKPEKKKNSFFNKAAASIAFGLLFGLSAGISFYAVRGVEAMASPTQDSSVQSAAEKLENAVNSAGDAATGIAKAENNGALGTNTSVVPLTTVTDVTAVVEKVMPSVVSITNMYTERNYYGQTRENEASGSGIIVGENDTEMLLVTNYHVIGGADTLMIQFIDGEQVEAQVKGSNAKTDLAVIAVQREDIKESTMAAIAVAKLGDSDSLQVGEPAIAIGNALGYGQSVTTGVISAVDRDIEMDGITGTFIQTDAAINPGNSGGALLNMKGEVIGINSNKIGGTVIEGMGYAIPITSAQPIMEDLMNKTTRVKVDASNQGTIGISGVNVTEDVASAYNMPQGIYVSQVYPDTAAANAGILKGNIITEFDSTEVTSMEELKSLLEYYEAGDTVEVTVMQGSPNGYTEVSVVLVLGSQSDISQTE